MQLMRTLFRLKETDESSYKEEAFNYQLEMLKIELDLISQAFERIDQMTQAIKNWSVVVWGGSIAVLLGVPDLRKFMILTGLVVLPFWYSEGRWRYYIKRFIIRQDKISDFLNSQQFIESFRRRQMVELTVLDPFSRYHFRIKENRRKTNTLRTMLSTEVSLFYLGMIAISIGVGLYFLLVP